MSLPIAAETSLSVDLSTCCSHMAAVARAMATVGQGYGSGCPCCQLPSSPRTASTSGHSLRVAGWSAASAVALEMVTAERTWRPCLVMAKAPSIRRWVSSGYATVDEVVCMFFRFWLQKQGLGKVGLVGCRSYGGLGAIEPLR